MYAEEVEELFIPELATWNIRAQCVVPNQHVPFWGDDLPSSLFVGPPRAGKSTAYFEVCFQLRDQFSAGIVFSNGHVVGKAPYAILYHEVYIYKCFTDEKLERIESRQNSVSQLCNTDEKKREFNPQLIVTFDDVINEKTRSSSKLSDTLNFWRHLWVFVVYLLHRVMLASSSMRKGCSHVYSTSTSDDEIGEHLTHLHTYFKQFKVPQFHREFFTHYTQNYGLIVKSQISPQQPITDYFSFRPPMRDEKKLFRMGSNEYWYVGDLLYEKRINTLKERVVKRVSRKPISEENEAEPKKKVISKNSNTHPSNVVNEEEQKGLAVDREEKKTKAKPRIRVTNAKGKKAFKIIPPNPIGRLNII